jgi:hypothetical protein
MSTIVASGAFVRCERGVKCRRPPSLLELFVPISAHHRAYTKAPVTERPVELPPGGKGLIPCSQQSNIVRKRPNTQSC